MPAALAGQGVRADASTGALVVPATGTCCSRWPLRFDEMSTGAARGARGRRGGGSCSSRGGRCGGKSKERGAVCQARLRSPSGNLDSESPYLDLLW